MSPSVTRLSPTVAFALLFAFAFVVRIPFAKHGNLSPDAADYIDIARSLADGNGLTQSIKWHFLTDAPTPRPAWGERPILLSVLMAPIVAVSHSLILLQAFNAALSALGVALLFLWARRAGTSDRAAVVAALLLAINPASIMCGVYVWTEPLFIALLLGVFIAITKQDNDTPLPVWRGALVGGLAALAFYARPTGILLLPVAIVWAIPRERRKAGVVFLFVMFALTAPHYAMVAKTHGTPFYSIQGQHLRVGTIEDAMGRGYGRVFPSAGEFIGENAGAVCRAIGQHLVAYTGELVGLSFFSVLTFFLIAALFATRLRGAFMPALLFAGIHFFAVGAIWGAPVDGNRFLLVPFVCALPAMLMAMEQWMSDSRRRLAVVFALALVVAMYGVLGARLYSGVKANSRKRPATVEFAAFVEGIPADAVLASPDPFMANFLYHHPTVVLPDPVDAARLSTFLADQRPDFIVGPPSLRDALAPFESNGSLAAPFAEVETGFLWWAVRQP